MSSTHAITDIAGLEAAVGRKNPSLDMKVIDHLDALALRWLEASSFGFATLAAGAQVGVTLVAAQPVQADERTVTMPISAWEHPEELQPGLDLGTLWLIPGVREGLRINGRISGIEDQRVEIQVAECFGHCGKALIRSDFWQADPVPSSGADLKTLVSTARFLALATVGSDGAADLSPKGDPAGLLVKMIDGDLYLAERPGNRRTDSLRNLLQQPQLALLLITPGDCSVARVEAHASVTCEPQLCAEFEVEGKQPKLVIGMSQLNVQSFDSRVLDTAKPWPASPAPADIEPAKIFATHIRLNKTSGLSARITKTMVSVPGLMDKALESDYKKNLY